MEVLRKNIPHVDLIQGTFVVTVNAKLLKMVDHRRDEVAVELLCAETFEVIRTVASARFAPKDSPVIPSRAIETMLFLEDKFAISQDYFVTVQSEIRPHMRKVLAVWLVEVSFKHR